MTEPTYRYDRAARAWVRGPQQDVKRRAWRGAGPLPLPFRLEHGHTICPGPGNGYFTWSAEDVGKTVTPTHVEWIEDGRGWALECWVVTDVGTLKLRSTRDDDRGQ